VSTRRNKKPLGPKPAHVLSSEMLRAREKVLEAAESSADYLVHLDKIGAYTRTDNDDDASGWEKTDCELVDAVKAFRKAQAAVKRHEKERKAYERLKGKFEVRS
jgi:hypothetical protein